MNDCMAQGDAMNMNNEQAVSILIPLRDMMRDQYGCPISDAYFALDKAIEALKQLTQPNTPNTLNALDTISRQAAIDAVSKALDRQTLLYGFVRKVALDAIKNLPSTQPEQRWIPCSERLPEIKEYHVSDVCIVYCENGAYGFAELEENIFGQVGWNCERDDEYHEPLGNVLAWMPLPEPYKEGEQNETD